MNKPPYERLQAKVEGIVQGVNFRHYTVLKARELGLTGWVANRYDGTVEVVAEGTRSSLEELLEFLKEGPPHAQVDRVSPRWSQANGEFRDFHIRG